MTPSSPIASPAPVRAELQYRAIRLIALLVKYDDKWLPLQTQMVRVCRRHMSPLLLEEVCLLSVGCRENCSPLTVLYEICQSGAIINKEGWLHWVPDTFSLLSNFHNRQSFVFYPLV